MIIPRTTKLTFNIYLLGTDKYSTLIKNLDRNIVRKLVVKLEGNEVISTDYCDIFCSYYDCWKSTTNRHNDVFQCIVRQKENAIKHGIIASDKASNSKDETVASIFDNKFCIPFDFEIFESGLPFYNCGLGSRVALFWQGRGVGQICTPCCFLIQLRNR